MYDIQCSTITWACQILIDFQASSCCRLCTSHMQVSSLIHESRCFPEYGLIERVRVTLYIQGNGFKEKVYLLYLSDLSLHRVSTFYRSCGTCCEKQCMFSAHRHHGGVPFFSEMSGAVMRLVLLLLLLPTASFP